MGPVFGNMRWCFNFMFMRIPIIAFLTLAAVAGGELAARAIDPTVARTEAQLRDGTAEAQKEEDEVSLTVGDLPKSDELAVAVEVGAAQLSGREALSLKSD